MVCDSRPRSCLDGGMSPSSPVLVPNLIRRYSLNQTVLCSTRLGWPTRYRVLEYGFWYPLWAKVQPEASKSHELSMFMRSGRRPSQFNKLQHGPCFNRCGWACSSDLLSLGAVRATGARGALAVQLSSWLFDADAGTASISAKQRA